MMESDVMDAEGSLHQKPRDVCAIEEVMNDESSLHQKTNEACIMEDAESIDLLWFENTKLNRVKSGTRCLLQVGVRDWESLGTSPSRNKKVWRNSGRSHGCRSGRGRRNSYFQKTHEWRNESIHVQPKVEPQNLDFDVNEFLRSSPNPLLRLSDNSKGGSASRRSRDEVSVFELWR